MIQTLKHLYRKITYRYSLDEVNLRSADCIRIYWWRDELNFGDNLNKDLISKFTGPFRDSIVFTAFMLAFGRMDPKHPAKKFAEGLVNPNVGRGANYNSVMKMKEVLDIQPDNEGESSFISATKYFRDLEGNGINSGTHEESIKSAMSP